MSKIVNQTITFLPNQPISFICDEENNCICAERTYQQFYYLTDIISFQFKSFGIEEIDYEFDNATGNFTEAYYTLCGTESGIGSAFSTNILEIGKHYRVTVTASGVTQGSVLVKLGSVTIGTISNNGEYVFSGKCSGVPELIFEKDADFDGCLTVDLIEKLCDAFTLNVYEESDLNTLITTDNSIFTQWGESVKCVTLVSDLNVEDGKCYVFCLKTACNELNKIVNGDFNTNLSGWTVEGNGFSWSAQKAKYAFAGQPESGLIQSILTIGKCYDFSVTFSPNDGAANGEWEIRNGGTILYHNTFLSATTITVTGSFTAVSADFGIFAISTATGNIDSVSVTVGAACVDSDCCSAPIGFKTEPEETDCSNKLFKYRNNENAYGFNFQSTGFTNFYFYLRLESRFLKPKYPEETEIFPDAAGTELLLYFKGRKSRILAIGNDDVGGVSEEIHDAVFLMRRHDSILIDGVSYVVTQGEYSPQWRDSNAVVAPSEIEVTKTTQLFENSYCS